MQIHSLRATALIAACALLVTACADTPRRSPAEASATQEQRRCWHFYTQLDRAVASAGVTDAEAARIAGFPYLRVDRYLASYRGELQDPRRWRDWFAALTALGAQGTSIEIANLPRKDYESLRQSLDASAQDKPALEEVAAACAKELAQADADREDTKALLPKLAQVRDDYSLGKRVAGLYPFTAIAFSKGIRRHLRETQATFAEPVAALPIAGTLTHYVPREGSVAAQPEIAAILKESGIGTRAIPQLPKAKWHVLFNTFAPVFAVDVANDQDRIGSVALPRAEQPTINVEEPVVYQRVSYTRLRGENLLQLNYVVWFPSRPKTSLFDMLGGEIDSIVWRVTLDRDGVPLMYDSIHSCGCYHMFFPAARLKAKPRPPSLAEWAFAPQQAPRLSPGERMLLRIASRTHYIERVLPAAPAGKTVLYQTRGYESLRSLALANGERRSLFAPDALVHASRRGERFLFWPMGIASAGAMRQWGHHATAFVGTRHFDDPDLIETAFEPAW